ncbi:MAG TPA: YqgE/AlgH family protein [Chitinophagaceae bacterium]|nr:YqgE/AlgH family protein [Chitinophagaceae bacterium]
MHAPVKGCLLIADPFLKDPHFSRAVIILCEHQEEGSLGFVINRPLEQTLDLLLPEMTMEKIHVHYGGPVQLNTMQFLHQSPLLAEGSLEILKGLYWGSHFEKAIRLVNEGKLSARQIRFFLGYTGWGTGQLDHELKEKSWILSKANRTMVFGMEEKQIWKESLRKMGDNFAIMANFPLDPSLN